MSKVTGWVVYNICDRSGGGFKNDHYIYAPRWMEEDDESIKDMIVSDHESWALYAESYYLKFEKNVIPPEKEIRAEMTRARHAKSAAQMRYDDLEKFLKEHYNGTL